MIEPVTVCDEALAKDLEEIELIILVPHGQVKRLDKR